MSDTHSIAQDLLDGLRADQAARVPELPWHTCRRHGTSDPAVLWACPECMRQARELLLRARDVLEQSGHPLGAEIRAALEPPARGVAALETLR